MSDEAVEPAEMQAMIDGQPMDMVDRMLYYRAALTELREQRGHWASKAQGYLCESEKTRKRAKAAEDGNTELRAEVERLKEEARVIGRETVMLHRQITKREVERDTALERAETCELALFGKGEAVQDVVEKRDARITVLETALGQALAGWNCKLGDRSRDLMEAGTIANLRALLPTDSESAPDAEGRIYDCAGCDKLRTKAEGGNIFSYCEECWEDRSRSGIRPPLRSEPTPAAPTEEDENDRR